MNQIEIELNQTREEYVRAGKEIDDVNLLCETTILTKFPNGTLIIPSVDIRSVNNNEISINIIDQYTNSVIIPIKYIKELCDKLTNFEKDIELMSLHEFKEYLKKIKVVNKI